MADWGEPVECQSNQSDNLNSPSIGDHAASMGYAPGFQHIADKAGPSFARIFADNAKLSHKRMARMLGYTLTLGSSDAWSDFATVAMVRLSIKERAALGWAALRSMDTPRHAEMVAESVLSIAGAPLPYLVSPMADARWWAADATQTELKAYALAAYEALAPAEQMAFRKYITEMEIAA